MSEAMNIKPKLMDTAWLKPYENNVKLHDEAQIKKIAKSISDYGWTTAIVTDKNGVIVAGHGRREAAILLGHKKVPVLVRDDLTDDQIKALRLADNRVAISKFDGEALRRELEAIDISMEGIFDAKELDFVNADLSVIDTSNFMDDVETAVREQADETAMKVSQVDEREVPIAKAVGFKTIKTKDEKYVATFIATIEASSGKQGSEAFVKFAKDYAEAV